MIYYAPPLLAALGLGPAYVEFVRSSGGSLRNGYHNLVHTMRVVKSVVEASIPDTPADRDILATRALAALYHDWGHPGVISDDAENVRDASQKVLSIRRLLPGWADHGAAAKMIRGTRFPMLSSELEALTDDQSLLRDMDIWNIGAYSDEEIFQSNVCGLAAEWEMTPKEVATRNVDFFKNAKTLTFRGAMLAEQYRTRLVSLHIAWSEAL